MKLPKSLIICGKTYKVIKDPKQEGASFRFSKQEIRLGTDYLPEKTHNFLIHEVLEIILADRNLRYAKEYSVKTNGDYLFCFNHDQYDWVAEELAYVLRQIYGL